MEHTPKSKQPRRDDTAHTDSIEISSDSVLVWKGMAECMKKMATQSGNQTMDEWMEATDDFNIAMQNGDIKRASKDLDLANACFAKAQYQMLNEDMGEFIGQVHYDFSKKLASGDMSAINQFMKEKKPQFDEEIAQA